MYIYTYAWFVAAANRIYSLKKVKSVYGSSACFVSWLTSSSRMENGSRQVYGTDSRIKIFPKSAIRRPKRPKRPVAANLFYGFLCAIREGDQGLPHATIRTSYVLFNLLSVRAHVASLKTMRSLLTEACCASYILHPVPGAPEFDTTPNQ